ncbi:MAG: hypothetical protein JWO88_2395, partial [Frankiales bacterium]|nr:hypothetical protein [Frankiales bacterium]
GRDVTVAEVLPLLEETLPTLSNSAALEALAT